MTYLLDANICIAFLKGSESSLRCRFANASPDQIRLCSIVKAELLYGARNSTRVAENLGRLTQFFSMFESLGFDDDCAGQYGVLRSQLRRAGTPVGGNDMMIAAIAITHDLTLATRNQAEFQRIGGIRLEEW